MSNKHWSANSVKLVSKFSEIVFHCMLLHGVFFEK